MAACRSEDHSRLARATRSVMRMLSATKRQKSAVSVGLYHAMKAREPTTQPKEVRKRRKPFWSVSETRSRSFVTRLSTSPGLWESK